MLRFVLSIYQFVVYDSGNLRTRANCFLIVSGRCQPTASSALRTRANCFLNLLFTIFVSLYQDFTKTARLWGHRYDKSKFEDYIRSVLDYNEQAANCDI